MVSASHTKKYQRENIIFLFNLVDNEKIFAMTRKK